MIQKNVIKRGLSIISVIGVALIIDMTCSSILCANDIVAPTTDEIKFVSAQIFRSWNVDPIPKESAPLQIAVKITIDPAGSVTSAHLDVDQSRYASDAPFRKAADAAVRAVLRASPLYVPPGQPGFFRDHPEIIINFFDPRQMLR
jgi:hypothetical protein